MTDWNPVHVTCPQHDVELEGAAETSAHYLLEHGTLGTVQIRDRNAIAALCLSALADWLTTVVGINYFGLVEANSVPADVHAASGGPGLLALSIVGVVTVVALCGILRRLNAPNSGTVATAMLWVAVAVNAVAAVHNALLMVG